MHCLPLFGLTLALTLLTPLPLWSQPETVAAEEPELLKEYVRSFAVKAKDTILIALQVPYEIVDWDRPLVRAISQVESFSLPKEYLTRLARKGRYSVTGSRKKHVLEIEMKKVGHYISVQGTPLTDEVAVRIYVPEGTPLKVICNNKTPQEQLKDLWLQQEVLTRRMQHPLRRLVDADAYPDVAFQEGIITAAKPAPPGARFHLLEVKVGSATYSVVSRIGKLYPLPADLVGQTVVFVQHNFATDLRNCVNQGMILLREKEDGSLGLMRPEDLPDFLLVKNQGS